jgi:uncharacterized membrane protein YqgA involved in biofilm formation
MYIEMTTFAIPTILITVFKAMVFFALAWIIGAVIGMWFYDRSLTKGIERNAEKCAKRMRGERIL